MYIKASEIIDNMYLAKSTLFKLIHRKKMRAIVLNGQYFVYWPDLKEYFFRDVIPNMIKIVEYKEEKNSHFLAMTTTEVLKKINIDARKFKKDFLFSFKETKENSLHSLQMHFSEKIKKINQNISTIEKNYQENYACLSFSLYLNNKHVYYSLPLIQIREYICQ